jgi:hypothetical protein
MSAVDPNDTLENAVFRVILYVVAAGLIAFGVFAVGIGVLIGRAH